MPLKVHVAVAAGLASLVEEVGSRLCRRIVNCLSIVNVVPALPERLPRLGRVDHRLGDLPGPCIDETVAIAGAVATAWPCTLLK